jgi:hypothetical protein
MEKDKNTSRANDTRSKSERPKVWVPPSSLDAPPDYPVVDDGKYKGVIGVGGLLLAKVPEEIARQRQEYMTNRHQQRDEAVKNDLMKEQDSRMPINVERQSRVTFGGTKKS